MPWSVDVSAPSELEQSVSLFASAKGLLELEDPFTLSCCSFGFGLRIGCISHLWIVSERLEMEVVEEVLSFLEHYGMKKHKH